MIPCSIITIGDELLIGQVLDTNSVWIAKQLNACGISVIQRIAVGDVEEDILQALVVAESKSDLIFITGGLGGTADDITKPTLCRFFETRLTEHADTVVHIHALFEKKFKRSPMPSNLSQAWIPENCIVLPNAIGTAPGMRFERNGKTFFSLPGVPLEMKEIVTREIIPYLKENFAGTQITHLTLLCYGISESALALEIQDIEKALPASVSLAYLPAYGQIRLRLSTVTAHGSSLQYIHQAFDQLQQRLKSWLVVAEDKSMPEVLADLLLQKKKTISTAESCTGGYIAHQFTSLPGSSQYFEGSVVSYSYPAKEKLLQVDRTTLSTQGAVSEAVVTEMAKGILKNLHTDYCIAVSGIMGPGGGMPGKPVGTVWIAVGNKNKIYAKLYRLHHDRLNNIKQTAIHAMNQMRRFILEENED